MLKLLRKRYLGAVAKCISRVTIVFARLSESSTVHDAPETIYAKDRYNPRHVAPPSAFAIGTTTSESESETDDAPPNIEEASARGAGVLVDSGVHNNLVGGQALHQEEGN